MVSITILSYLNLITILLFAFTIKTGILETFLSKIGNLRVKRLAKNFVDENKMKLNHSIQSSSKKTSNFQTICRE